MARDLNGPEHWLAWLRSCAKAGRLDTTVPLGAITGTDARILRVIAGLWSLCGYHDDDPLHVASLAAIRSLLPSMQPSTRPFARELIAQALDWHDRDRLWPLVSGERSI